MISWWISKRFLQYDEFFPLIYQEMSTMPSENIMYESLFNQLSLVYN